MLGDVRARKYSKNGARTRSILEKFAFDTTLIMTLGQRPYDNKSLSKVIYYVCHKRGHLKIPLTCPILYKDKLMQSCS